MISVVIPAYNEEKWIRQTLDSLVAQKTSHDFEVIVVDNNSTDRTREIVSGYEKKLQLRLVTEKYKGRSPARKKGFSDAKGEIILSTDADTVVPRDWVEQLSKYVSDTQYSAVTGGCVITDCSWFTNRYLTFFHPYTMILYRVVFGHYWLNGFNFGIRKDVYETSGGFNEELDAQEDTDLAFRVAKLGKIRFVRSLKVDFSGRRFRKGLWKALGQYASTYVAYYLKKNPKETILSDVR